MVASFLWLLWKFLGGSCGGCPYGYGVVGFDLGLILSFDSHRGCD